MKYIQKNSGSKKIYKILIYFVCFALLILFSAVMQTTCLTVFGKTPAVTFAVICAIGFIMGDKAGAVAGLFAGVCVDMLGFSGLSFSPVIYMLCGYDCGAFVGWFLSRNLPSFLVYAAIMGIIKELGTAVSYGLIAEDLNIGNMITKLLIPEYFAYLIFVLPSYGAVYGIYWLFKGKEKREKHSYNDFL